MNESNKLDMTAKPYPRRCGGCGHVAVESVTISHHAKVKHDGKLHEFFIERLPVDQCAHCGEQFFTNATADAKAASLRDHLGLLQPATIRELLIQHNLTQRKLAAHLRIAEETVSRWLSGLSIQSRALDVLMRLYFTMDNVRAMLAGSDIPASRGTGAGSGPGLFATEASAPNRIHQVFGRSFPMSTIERSIRFELMPSNN